VVRAAPPWMSAVYFPSRQALFGLGRFPLLFFKT